MGDEFDDAGSVETSVFRRFASRCPNAAKGWSVNRNMGDDPQRHLLAPWALRTSQSRGRRFPEKPHPFRGPFQRDRDRILHCAAFRRLSEKTQVFTTEVGDYHRTRLTHTLEVASVARTVGRVLRLNEDFIEALALLHDIGHPPFGHTGEQALHSFLASEGGFQHNRQALRIVEKLEHRYPDFPGLNLSLEVLQGQEFRAEKKERPAPLLEVQVVDAADSISYLSHDADDALEMELLELQDLSVLPIWRGAVEKVRKKWADLNEAELRREVIRTLIDRQVTELIEASRRRIETSAIETIEDVPQAGRLVFPCEALAEQLDELRAFLFQRVYRHPRIIRYRKEVRCWLRDIFHFFLEAPNRLPRRYEPIIEEEGASRAVADWIGNLTDRAVRLEYLRLVQEGEISPRSPLEKSFPD